MRMPHGGEGEAAEGEPAWLTKKSAEGGQVGCSGGNTS